MSDAATRIEPTDHQRRLVLWAAAALGVSAVITQLALMREMLCAFSGNEMALGVILGNWLLLTGLGTWLGRSASRLRQPFLVLVLLLVLVAVLPIVEVFALRALRNIIFIRGSVIGVTETVVSSFIVLLPFCVVSGFMLTLACSLLAAKEGTLGIGRVYVADSVGSILGGVVFSFVMVRLFDHIGILYLPALVNLALAIWLAFSFGRKILAGFAALLAVGCISVMMWTNLDAASTDLQYVSQRVIFRGNSPYGKLVVTETAGQFNFIENGVPVISTENTQQVEETVHYAMSQRPDARKVLLVSGGVSGTAREILKYGVNEVTYVELDPLIIAVGREYLPHTLDDARIRVVTTDGRLFIKRTAERFDVVIVDMPDPSTSQINRFFTAEFYAEARRVLAPGGVLCFSLGHYENYVSEKLARLLASAHRTAARVFASVLVIPGGRVFFIASDGELHADIAARVEARRIPTRLVNRHYLDAMLHPDRMADMARAVAQPAAVNEDFNPVLYFYHLVHWMSQFKVQFGVLEGALLLALAVYLLRMRAVPLAIFASGFAASALEVVLLLGFQILYGSVYHQLGVIVTVFMAGLAAGAWVMNRWWTGAGRRDLSRLAFAIAALAILLPFALKLLGAAGSGSLSLVAVQAAIALLTFVLAFLVGMEFPLASKVESGGAAARASRLYTADFVGACLGALLASTLLIPLLGVTAACLLTAGLNVVGGVAVLLRKG